MVERLQEMTETLQDMTLRGATFVDLDGTLLQGNSMRIFMRRLPAVLLSRRAPRAAAAALGWMVLRAVRLVSHRTMKWRLTRIARRHFEDDDWQDIAGRMLRRLNPRVEEYVNAPSRAQCARYIATAAIEEYTLPLARLLGYDGAIATPFTEIRDYYVETRGAAKRDAIRDLLDEKRLRLESFLTDHTDDLPTAVYFPRLTILVSTSRRVHRRFAHIGAYRYL